MEWEFQADVRNTQQNEEWRAGNIKGTWECIKDPVMVLKDAGIYQDDIAMRAIEKVVDICYIKHPVIDLSDKRWAQ